MYNFITLKQLRPKLPTIIEDVDERLGRYIIAKHGHPVAILLSIVDFESLIDTAEEITDKENLKRIQKGICEARKGRTVNWNKIKRKFKI
ncbi:MAG: hypothetical protein A2053_02020 [Deltaproteobacteria bacterium GWA2_50_8]|nr:MAG: hypothetical protein A2053_02020 [Deltaproteobacteria bacterium GWA2_50_8]